MLPPNYAASPTLQTPRLFLRPFLTEDLDVLARLMANADFMRFSTGTYSREQTATFLEKVSGWARDGLPSQFAVIMRDTGELFGYCGFFHQLVDEFAEVEIGYRLHPNYWNRGLATEAARAVRDHGFRDLQLARLISLIHVDNAASRRVAEKNRMMLEKQTLFRGFPTNIFAISRQQWLKEVHAA
ncbi:MAG: putative acetyltransferase [Spartobacteria bacterium]|nr:putative acetyltransferase [Spartobacteria bacterium]